MHGYLCLASWPCIVGVGTCSTCRGAPRQVIVIRAPQRPSAAAEAKRRAESARAPDPALARRASDGIAPRNPAAAEALRLQRERSIAAAAAKVAAAEAAAAAARGRGDGTSVQHATSKATSVLGSGAHARKPGRPPGNGAGRGGATSVIAAGGKPLGGSGCSGGVPGTQQPLRQGTMMPGAALASGRGGAAWSGRGGAAGSGRGALPPPQKQAAAQQAGAKAKAAMSQIVECDFFA